MKITSATSSDIPALCELLAILFTQEADFKPDHDAQCRGLARIIGNPEVGIILVARQNGRIVGMLNLLYTISTAFGEQVALLEDMIVSPDVRCAGVGSQLLEQAIYLARLNGCKRITLLTDQANEPAQRFYKKHGFGFSAMIPLRLFLK
ncbi:MAG: GNAT family N-acetyltransferase [Methylococcales bacterium]|nr:GNAT family N-acetyltransferase [Methylococcaceae bacterium]